MKTKLLNLIVALAVLAWLSTLNLQLSASPLGTAFTYQGRLTDTNGPVTGSYDLCFSLYDSAADVTGQLGTSVTNSPVPVTNGLFTVALDFGYTFTSNATWLQIQVRTNGAGPFTTLSPRQPLTPTPYALYAPSAGTAVSAVAANSVSVGAVTAPGIASGQVVKSLNTLHDDVALAAGANVTLTPSGQTLILAGPTDWHVTGNAGIAAGNFLGTTENQALELKVDNQRALRFEPNATSPNLIGGHSANSVAAAIFGSTIGGGGAAGDGNSADAAYATIAGGVANSIQTNAGSATISGGNHNTIQTNATHATISGGAGNSIRYGIPYQCSATNSAVGGGYANTVYSASSVIGGGFANGIGNSMSRSFEAGHTIGGGIANGINYENTASTISGGTSNSVDAAEATIAGGRHNRIEWAGVTRGHAIGGGAENNIRGAALGYSTIAGGHSNAVSSDYGAIGGGLSNRVSGVQGCIPGGGFNTATHFAFAAGHRAKAANMGAFVWADSTEADFTSTDNDQFLIRASGGVGIGNTSPAAVLDVYGTRSISAASDGIVNIGTSSGYHVTLDGNELHARNGSGTSTLYLNHFGGNIHVGQQLYAVYGSGVGIGTTSLSGYKFYVNGTAYSTGGWSGSDARWKTNVQPVTQALKKVMELQGVTYDWRRAEFPDRNFEAAPQLGFLAQDVERVVPEAVRTDSEGYKAIAYEKLTAVLTEGVKEQQQEIEALKARIEQLERLLKQQYGGVK